MTDANRPIIDPSTGEIIDGWVAHPAADLFPMAQADELDGLTADIAEHGLVESIWTADDGVVLDGRNRLVACHRLGLNPTVKRYRGDDPITFAVSLNLHRRHLTVGQQSVLGLELEQLFAEEARKKQAEAGGDKSKTDKALVADRPQALNEERAPTARDRAAAAVGISGRSLGRTKRIAEKAPDLIPEIKAGTLAPDRAEKILKDRLDEPRRRAQAEAKAKTEALMREHRAIFDEEDKARQREAEQFAADTELGRALGFLHDFLNCDIALIGEAQDPDKWQGITNLASRIRDRIDTMEEMSRDRLD